MCSSIIYYSTLKTTAMLRYLIIVCICSSVYGGVLPKHEYKFFKDFNNHQNRIVGGEDASILDAPWQVSMLLRTGLDTYLACGASIIKPSVFLSAASCIYGSKANEWRSRVGTNLLWNGGQFFGIQKTIIHEMYRQTSNIFDYDIGLFIPFQSVDMNDPSVSIVSLPLQDQLIPDGTVGLITGWGSAWENGPVVEILQKASIPVVNQQQCASTYQGLLTDRMVCLGDFESAGLNACFGDTGGPFAVDGVILGVTSWSSVCGEPGYPGVWSRVPSFKDWIIANMPDYDSN